MCEELNSDLIIEHIRNKSSDIKDNFKKRGKNFQKLDIFEVEGVKTDLINRSTEIKFFRLSELYKICSASKRIPLEVERDNNPNIFLRIEPVLKEIQSGKVRIPVFIGNGKCINIVDGIHRIYILYHIFKEEDPEIPIIIIKKDYYG